MIRKADALCFDEDYLGAVRRELFRKTYGNSSFIRVALEIDSGLGEVLPQSFDIGSHMLGAHTGLISRLP